MPDDRQDMSKHGKGGKPPKLSRRRKHAWQQRRAFGRIRLVSGQRVFALGGTYLWRCNGERQSEWRAMPRRSGSKEGSMLDGQEA